MNLFRRKENLGSIMVCYEDSDIAREALMLAQGYAKQWRVAIDVVSTYKREQALESSEIKQMKGVFQSLIRKQFINTNVPYDMHLLIDIYSSGEQLVKFAENRDYRFIFIGISKRSKVGKILFGSTAQYVILNAPYPVITVNGIKS
jgi:nucleotide-binding universal stress UspA family protein